MTGYTRSPPVQRGALIGVDPMNPLASVVVFQYNPDSMSRTLTPRGATGGGGSAAEAMRLQGPPTEKINIDVELDSTDQLSAADSTALAMGLHPVLASLEMMLYPKSALVIANEVLALAGVIEVIPPEAPLTLLVWGIQRIVPVRVTSVTITEEAFDTRLNPIRAKAQLALDVLSYHDLGLVSPGGGIFMAHQIMKEVLASIHGVGAISSIVSTAFEG